MPRLSLSLLQQVKAQYKIKLESLVWQYGHAEFEHKKAQPQAQVTLTERFEGTSLSVKAKLCAHGEFASVSIAGSNGRYAQIWSGQVPTFEQPAKLFNTEFGNAWPVCVLLIELVNTIEAPNLVLLEQLLSVCEQE